LLAKAFGHFLGDRASDDVLVAARHERHDEADGLARECLRERRKARQQGKE
jgi:hypothetical protein